MAKADDIVVVVPEVQIPRAAIEQITQNSLELISKEGSQVYIQSKLTSLPTYINELTNILAILQTKKKTKSKDLKDIESIMKVAYTTIMGFRTYFLGEGQEIQYRLYLKHKNNSVSVYDFNEQTLMSIVNPSDTGLRLMTSIKDMQEVFNSKSIEMNTVVSSLVQQLESGIWAHLKQPERGPSGTLIVDDEVANGGFNTLGLKNGNLIWQNQAPENPKEDDRYYPMRKLFNKGWAYEAFDRTADTLYFNNSQANFNATTIKPKQFYTEYFTNSLKRDNNPSYTGGDVGLNQVKSNLARLMSITTMITGLEHLIKMLKEIQVSISATGNQNLQEYLKFFFTKDETISQEIQTYYEKVVNDVIKQNLTK